MIKGDIHGAVWKINGNASEVTRAQLSAKQIERRLQTDSNVYTVQK